MHWLSLATVVGIASLCPAQNTKGADADPASGVEGITLMDSDLRVAPDSGQGAP